VFECKSSKTSILPTILVKTSKTDDTSYHEMRKYELEFLTLFINQFNKPISQPATIALKKEPKHHSRTT
jgi:hypothetical protein